MAGKENENMVYLNLDKEFIDKNLKKLNEDAISELGEVGKEIYFYNDDTEGHIDEIGEEEGRLYIVADNSKIGYISLDIKLDTETLIDLLEMAVKKLNKFKTILEGLK